MDFFFYEEAIERMKKGEAVQSLASTAVYTIENDTLHADGVPVPPSYMQLNEVMGTWMTSSKMKPEDTYAWLIHPTVCNGLHQLFRQCAPDNSHNSR